MAQNTRVVIDAGHGGTDPGATFFGRREKDDVLQLAFAVGKLLENEGVNVLYTRVDDTYYTPFERAQMANNAEADYLISLHRNDSNTPNLASGVESVVYENSGVPAVLAKKINGELQKVGFRNLGVVERPGLVILKRSKMPAVLVEIGFVDNEADNLLFDSRFLEIAQAVAQAVITAVAEEENSLPMYYQVQTGAFREYAAAEEMRDQLRREGYPAYIVNEDGYYKVRAAAYLSLDNASQTERELRRMGYQTFLVTGPGGT